MQIGELTPREQRIRRKGWCERAKMNRAKKKGQRLLLERFRVDSPVSDAGDLRVLPIPPEEIAVDPKPSSSRMMEPFSPKSTQSGSMGSSAGNSQTKVSKEK